jgi:LacI family transcriptional regulator
VLLGAVDSPGLRRAVDEREPVVLVNRRFPGKLTAPFVGTDNVTAAAAVADYFVAHGLETVTIIHGPLTSSATEERVRGFIDRFRAIAQQPDGIACYPVANFSKEAGYRGSMALFRAGGPPRAIFCTSDEIAYGAGRACREAGLTPEHDVTIFGFDGSPMNEFLAPWLGTVQVSHETYGPAITDLLQIYWQGSVPDGAGPTIPYQLLPALRSVPQPHPA